MSAYRGPSGWDPLGSSSLRNVIAYSQLYNQLVQYDTVDTNAITGDMAQSWDVSQDGLTYTFNLREGMTWNDGEPITSEDVVTAMARYANPCNSAGRSGIWRHYTVRMTVAELNDKADCTPTNQADVLQADGPNTVQFSMRAPSAAFLKWLAMDFVKVLPAHLLDEGIDLNDYQNIIDHQSGSGPFALEEYRADDFYHVNRNQDYFKAERPLVDRIEHKIIQNHDARVAGFEAGSLDLANAAPSGPDNEHSLYLETTTDGAYVAHPIIAGVNHGLMLNVKKPQLRDSRVRMAINLAVNRQEINRRLLDSPGASYCPLSGLAHSNQECLTWPGIRPKTDAGGRPTVGGEEDLAEAKALMTEAGYPDGFEVTYTVRQIGNYFDVCSTIKRQLEEALGIVGKIEGLSSRDGLTKFRTSRPSDQEGDWEIACQAQGLTIYDVEAVYPPIYLKGGVRNYTDWSHPKLDAWYEAQEMTLDPAQRWEINKDAELWLHGFSDNHWVTLGTQHLYWLVHQDVQGFNPPSTAFYQFKHEDLWLDR